MNFVTISSELAYRAYSGISFSPEKRRDSTIKEFNESLQNDYDGLLKLAVSEPQIIVLNEEFERYQGKYKSMYENYLYAKSRTISPMITGPARFPVARNEKAMNSEMKRWHEFSTWSKKAYNAIERKIKEAKTDEQRQADNEKGINQAMEYLLKESISVIVCVGGQSPYSPSLLKASLERKILNFADNNPDMAIRVVNEINLMCREKYNKDVFTSKHPILSKIEALKQRKIQAMFIEEKENETLFKSDAFEVINNFKEERVQIIFPGKPDEKTRNLLKSNAFKWAPSQGAWQRQNTLNGMYATKKVIEQLTV